MRMRGNSIARSLIQRMASQFSRNGSMSSTSGRCCRTSLFASSKVCAAPQTRYLSSRPTIVAIPCSLTQVSPTTTTRIGCAPVEAVGLFLTFCESTNRSGPLQSFNCVFCEKYFQELPGEVLDKNLQECGERISVEYRLTPPW